MKSDASVNIKSLLDSGSYAIVFDTNVFLNLYRVSPDYADFLLTCLNAIKEYIAVPKTVQIEFLKHNKALYKRRQKNIEHFIEDSITLIRNQKEKIIHSCSVLKKVNSQKLMS